MACIARSMATPIFGSLEFCPAATIALRSAPEDVVGRIFVAILGIGDPGAQLKMARLKPFRNMTQKQQAKRHMLVVELHRAAHDISRRESSAGQTFFPITRTCRLGDQRIDAGLFASILHTGQPVGVEEPTRNADCS